MDEQRGQTAPRLSNLAGGVVSDFEELIGQHFDMIRAEVKQELRQVSNAVGSLTAGAGATAAGGILGTLAAVHLLQKLTGLPLWACYALVGGGLGLLGGGLVARGVKQVSDVDLLPRETFQTVKEELAGSRS
jgi:hypothetical protein